MKKSLFVIFGLPGAGKSFVANILNKRFGYFIYDGDLDIPIVMRYALFNKEEITDTMRKEFICAMIASVKTLAKTHKRLAIHQTFLKGFMRKQFLEAFPETQFILVESPDILREKRYMKRKYFNLGLSYLRHMSALFETPQIPHETFYNGENEKDLLQVIFQFFAS
jgi:gluconate kinase